MDLNRAEIIGRLTADPEIRTTQGGAVVASFSVATNFTYNDQSGQKKETVEYHNVVAWRKLAEIIGQYLKKGRRVYIAGRLQTSSWDGNDGTKKYKTEIVASDMIMLDGGAGKGDSAVETGSSQVVNEEIPTIDADTDISADEIPF